MNSNPLDNREKLVAGAEAIAHCLKEKADEDAYQWCLAVLEGLYNLEARRRVKLEKVVNEARRLSEE